MATARVRLSDEDLRVLSDPAEVMARFQIESKAQGKEQFNNPNPCQIMLFNDWWDPERRSIRRECRRTDIAKARQMGMGLMVQSFIAAVLLGTEAPVNVMTVAHTEPTMQRHIARYKEIVKTLPAAYQPGVKGDGEDKWWWANGTKFHGATAGGKKGKGQGYTFQMLHGTECGMYTRDAEATIQSLMSTMHDASPWFFEVFESTSEGPGGWWEKHVRRSREPGSGRNFRFFPWTIEPTYRTEFESKHARQAFIDSMEPDERDIVVEHSKYVAGLKERDQVVLRDCGLLTVTPEQLLWRRNKLVTTSKELFGYDFPLTVQEAFLHGGVSWFPKLILEDMRRRSTRPVRIQGLPGALLYEPPEMSKRYAVGVDVGEGTENDYSVICVIDHRMNQVFTWADNVTSPEQVGELAVRIAHDYNGALLLIESNKAGGEALKAARRLGYRHLYMERGKDYTTWGNQHTVSSGQGGKHGLLGHARTQLNAKRCRLHDELTIDELISVRDDVKGSLGAPKGKHDDRAMAWCMAMWAVRMVQDPVIEGSQRLVDLFTTRESSTLPV